MAPAILCRIIWVFATRYKNELIQIKYHVFTAAMMTGNISPGKIVHLLIC